MGRDYFLINHETKQLFMLRNVHDEEKLIKAAATSKDDLLQEIKKYQRGSEEDYINWLTNILWDFTRTKEKDKISLAHDWDYGGLFFTVEDEGYKIIGTMWDYFKNDDGKIISK